jgi:hypothetical protein
MSLHFLNILFAENSQHGGDFSREKLIAGDVSFSAVGAVERDGRGSVHHRLQNAWGFPIADIRGEPREQVPVGQRF